MIAGGAFRDAQFLRFFVGIFFAVQAIWVQRVTLSWLAWERTNSAGFVGLVAALSLSPTLVAGPLFGVIADRVNIRNAAFVTNGAMAAILSVLALSLPYVEAWGIAAAAFAIGVVSSAHHPVRMSLGPRLVPREVVQHVVSVTALNFNLARLVAPVVAGWIIAGAGAGVALWVSVACYVPMLAVLPSLRPRDLPPRPRAPMLTELREGVAFARDNPLIREALLLTLIFATIVRGALEVLPVLADGAFGQGAAGLGMLTAAAGGGAVLAASVKFLGFAAFGAHIPRPVIVATFAGFLAVVAMGFAPVWPLALAATSAAGFCATWCGVSLQAAIQTDLPDAYRGRVMSLWTVVGFGTVAIGAALIGAIAEVMRIGPALAVAGALGVVVTGAWRVGGARA
ncbi:MFS transporter [Roseibacterium sp. SDUM158017]|uniref:MFS transporter n=1 Tax=Roseicyclus salinarum TaxID=3036773 RepID=UPI0024153BC6|nr:MFS transporter [Roseibacterium sp. SDUM158017]MDG4647703.1 MFS transporter [Roseibacterium sp. SDUM158017]